MVQQELRFWPSEQQRCLRERQCCTQFKQAVAVNIAESQLVCLPLVAGRQSQREAQTAHRTTIHRVGGGHRHTAVKEQTIATFAAQPNEPAY